MEWALTDFYILDSAMGTELAYRGYDYQIGKNLYGQLKH